MFTEIAPANIQWRSNTDGPFLWLGFAYKKRPYFSSTSTWALPPLNHLHQISKLWLYIDLLTSDLSGALSHLQPRMNLTLQKVSIIVDEDKIENVPIPPAVVFPFFCMLYSNWLWTMFATTWCFPIYHNYLQTPLVLFIFTSSWDHVVAYFELS